MKTIPKDVKDKVIQLRREGLSLLGIAERVAKEGFKLSRPTVARLCQEAGNVEEAPKRGDEGISAKIQNNLDDALNVTRDAIEGISKMLDNPMTKNAVLKELEENGITTSERIEQFMCEEEAKREKLQRENDYLRQRLIIAVGMQNENTKLQSKLVEAHKEIERLKGVERALRVELLERNGKPSMKDIMNVVLLSKIMKNE